MPTEYCLLIPGLPIPAAPERRVLLRPEGSGWDLPRMEHEGDWLAADAEAVRGWLRREWGLEATVLRQLEAGDGEVFAEIEAHDPAWTPPDGASFFGADDPPLAFLPEESKRVVEAWMAGEGSENTAAPWERRGWFAEAVAWIDARLAESGVERTGGVRQVKAAWAGSAVLAAPTAAGELYFKATAGTPGEARVLAELARRWSDRLPELVAADPERGWMLTRDLCAQPLLATAREEALRSFAELQVGEAAHLDRWRALGCLDRGPESLAASAHRILAEIPRLLVEAGVLGEAEAAELARFESRVVEICGRLPDLGVPLSIHHEDFRDAKAGGADGDGNVVISRGRPVFFDWADTVIAHPFFSLQRFPDDVEPPEDGAPWDWRFAEGDPRAVLRDAYLGPWEALAPRAHLLEAFELTRQLEGFYQMVRYDAAVDLVAWLDSRPSQEELALAQMVIGAVLMASRG